MSSFEPVGLAIVGAGNIAHVHAEAISQVPEARPRGGVREKCRAGSVSRRKISETRVYSSVDEMLVNAQVEGRTRGHAERRTSGSDFTRSAWSRTSCALREASRKSRWRASSQY